MFNVSKKNIVMVILAIDGRKLMRELFLSVPVYIILVE